MKNGAFALLDCLGFKGIWNRGVEPDLLLAFLKQAASHADHSPTITASAQWSSNIEQSIVFVSDTVAISNRFKSPPKMPDLAAGYLVHLTILIAAELAKKFVDAPAPLMLRGCITFGPHIAEDRFLIGPAVDEAASFSDTAQGAFIWLNPTSEKLFRKYRTFERSSGAEFVKKMSAGDAISRVDRIVEINRRFEAETAYPAEVARNRIWWTNLPTHHRESIAREILTMLAIDGRNDLTVPAYPMEIKASGQLEADVVNPMLSVTPSKHDEWISRALSGFTDTPIDVLLKRQNTARFLKVASKATCAELARTNQIQASFRQRFAELTGLPF